MSVADSWVDPLGERGVNIKSTGRATPNNHVSDEDFATPLQESDLRPTSPADFGSSLEGHPAFKKIVTYARQTFGTATSMVTVIDGDQLVYLAETGLGERSMPFVELPFCLSDYLLVSVQ